MNEDGQNPKESRIGRLLLFLILLLLVVIFVAAQLGLSSTNPKMVNVRIQPQRTADYGPWEEILVRRVDPVVGTLVAEDFLATITTTAVTSIAQIPTVTETRLLPTLHPSITPSNTPTMTNTPTATLSPTATDTQTPTITLSPTVTESLTPSITPSFTRTPTATPTPTLTRTPSNTPTPTRTSVPISPPRAEFSWQQTTANPPYQVDFFNLSSGGVATSIIWNFGDGGSSTLREPTHYFSSPGTYLVSLTMSGPGGTDTVLHDVLVLDAVRANFTYLQDPNGVNQIQFVNLSSGLLTITSWNFGDGTSSLLANPVHAYNAPGTYIVSLMVNGPIGSDTISLPVTVYAAPTANFTASPASVTLGQAVSVNNTSTRSLITGYQWNYGDGIGTSTLADPLPYTYTAAGTYTITLTVFGPGGADTHTQTVTVLTGADMRVTKTVSDTSPMPGDIVDYTITAFNNGPLPAANVLVNDQLPADVNYISDNSGGAYDDVTGEWNIGSMPVGGSAALAITVQVDPLASFGTNITNTATISSSQVDPNNANNSASVTMVVTSDFDLAVTKTVNEDRPNIGDTITYTITVTNLSATIGGVGIEIRDTLPTAVIYQSDSGGASYNPGTGIWTVGALGPGAMATLNINVTVGAGASPGVPITNTATLTDVTPADPNPANNTANAVFQVAVADLSLTLSSSDYNPLPGDTITITVTINNAGPDAATNVQVGLENFPSISAGDSDGYSYNFPIPPNYLPGPIEFVAEIDAADQFDPDSTPGNLSTTEDDDDQITVTVQPAADLEVTITADNMTPSAGATVILTITVDNLGPVDATGVEVFVPLPVGLAYISDDGGGAYNMFSETWTIGVLAVSDLPVTLNLTTQVSALAGASLDITADVSGSPTDHIPANNSDTVTLNVTP